ncbi:hypothetical protein GT204_07730 [Streptomyces sp. SID4919]|uniref:helix-turn-helix transcriptional regulator n=1 Tax=unclassified Streptomyces TaxID=2593676 RepID=UPI0008239203|nr:MULTISPECIES: helix-turn-helix transcriptional regulator [unclassified Streptomyces]MYY08795.1 hypothetical protein [Streptomyces sp. SID4919]SCK25305.1 Helix-turn-helix [Streptomyces sp. AmelKG-E11A]
MTTDPHPPPALDAPFITWLRWALAHRGYDPDARGVQKRIADASDIPVATVSRLLRNRSQPDVSTCYALGLMLGMPVMPILVRAGHLPPAVLETTATPPPVATPEDALVVLGVTDPTDQAAVLAMITALTAKDRRDGIT